MIAVRHIWALGCGMIALGLAVLMGVTAWRLIFSSPSWWHLAKSLGALGLAMLMLISLDSGLGYVRQAFTKPLAIETIERAGATGRVYVILPGYNQDGAALAKVLAPRLLARGSILSYELPRDGFDQKAIVSAVLDTIKKYRNNNSEIIVYAESAGALETAMLLRADATLRLHKLVINAGVSSWRDLKAGAILQLTRPMAGGPLLTQVLRSMQRGAVAGSPALDSIADTEAAEFAQQNSLRITGPQAIAEFRRMVTTPAVKHGEFIGRVGACIYMHAPGTSDEFVKTARASATWEQAAGCTDRVIEQYTEGKHVPTPEQPAPVVAALLG